MKTKIGGLLILIGILRFTALPAQNYKLVWEDNFEGSTLDSSKWNVEQRVGVWNTGSNKELQHYKKSNVAVGDDGNGKSCLIITAKKENYNGYAFTSGKITTKGKFAFKRGKVEVSIKMPDLANGLWPAFWSLGYTPVGWPDCGEIDILEMGHAKGITDGVQNSFIGSHLFWGPYDNGVPNYGKEFTTTEDLSTGFFKHTVIWTETKISVYFNDASTPYFTMSTGDNIEEFKNFQEYLILNLAVGGSLPGINTATGITAPMPASMYVDWVKVYQEDGMEDYTSNLDIFGDFGVFEDETTADMRMDLNYDLSEEMLGLTKKTDELPYEGDNVLSYNVTSGNDYEMKLTAGLPRNMTNYNEGSIQFYIKTNITTDIQIGIADTAGNEKFISFNSSNSNNFFRDGSWQSAYISLADYADVVDISALKQMLIIKGNPDAVGYFSIDKVVFKETVPAKGYYAIFSDNLNITDGFVVDNVTNNMYVWSNTITFNDVYPAYEGENVHSFKSSGGLGWYGFGYISLNPLNFEAYANGYLNISIKTTSVKEFYIGLDGESTNAEIHFKSGSDPYGFKRDGEWHQLNIPFKDLTNLGLDLTSVKHVFKTGGTSIENLAYDDIYYSEALPTIENPMVCYANSITITPATKTIEVGKEFTFKAAVLNQFGNKFDNKVVWSTTGGVIDGTGKFSSLVAGDFTISAMQDAATANAIVKVLPQTAIEISDAKLVNSYINNNLNKIIVTNLYNDSYVSVYSISGQLIYASKSNLSTLSIDMTNQPSGIYIVKVISTNTIHTNRVIKQ